MKGVQCYELFGGIELKNQDFISLQPSGCIGPLVIIDACVLNYHVSMINCVVIIKR